MTKLLFFLIFCFYSFGILAQNSSKKIPGGINTCIGAVNVFENGIFNLQFTGKKSENILEAYSSLSSIEKENQIWISFIAPSSGQLTFKAEKEIGFIQMAIFEQGKGEICSEIKRGVAEIARLFNKRSSSKVGLDFTTGDGVMYTLKIQKNQKINILLATEKKNTDKVQLNWNFEPAVVIIKETKIIDKRFDDFAPTFSILVRDKTTKEPLVAALSIEQSKTVNGLYTASDVFLNVERKCDMKIKCDIEGYFYSDTIVKVSPYDDMEVKFELERIKSGSSIKIEDIEFKPGSSEITNASIPKLKRLKDFLLLNSDINIEIQGHVFSLGDNSFTGQKISEARAKRIRKYLIDNGIDKHRLEAKGYGNTKPVYEEPRFSYEEQANRRVEILVL